MKPSSPVAAATVPRERRRAKRLSYIEQREWEGMERAIQAAEAAVEARRKEAGDPAIASNPSALQDRHAALAEAEIEVNRLYARWAELEKKQEEGREGP